MPRTLGKSFAKQLALKEPKRLVGGAMTFNEVVNGIIKTEPVDKEKIWDHHINAVKEMIDAGKINKMAIAEIAIRSCFIIYGGDVKSEEFKKRHQPHTLSRFAAQTNLHYKTLQMWTQLKRWVFDALPKHHQATFRMDVSKCVYQSLIELTIKDVGGTRHAASKQFEKIDKKTVLELYERYAKPGSNYIWMQKLFSYQRIIHHWLTTPVKSKNITDAALAGIIDDNNEVAAAAMALRTERAASVGRRKQQKVKHEPVKEENQGARA